MRTPKQSVAIASIWTLLAALPLFAQSLGVSSTPRRGNLPLVRQNKAAPIIFSPDDHKVVRIAASDLAADIERVTGKRPAIIRDNGQQIDIAVIVGTLGQSSLIDRIAKSGKLDVSKIRGKWESYIIETVEDPLPNIEHALVIAGSDRRGTAFGIYELSRMIGVSPWNWWADVTPDKRTNLYLSSGKVISREPSVKYRGIFINDEDWGLQPWAAKTFEPETGNIGPKTYAKVFELLLRLKANTLWPAMHEVTRPFNSIAGNAKMADDYAIVMGSSHAEPMLRNNVGEWTADKDAYNFVTNSQGITDYWEKRVKENGKFENIYTIGMRGIHDSPLIGTKSQAERIPLLEKIFSVQRGLIAKHVNANVETVPQIFCPYKEVLADYRSGLKVPDDVTVVFPDDNFGYIRQFPTAEEQRRKGGFGVYYHISYLGRPLSYLWLNTTPPALIWEEMSKAYANGMRQLWIVNVGDIKPGEIGMEYFLSMAYDVDGAGTSSQIGYLRKWASREFGSRDAAEISSIMDKYYRLGFERKPEHLQWYLNGEDARPSDLSEQEKIDRLIAYNDIRKRAEAIYAAIVSEKRDAFFELVLYPVRSAALANERFFAAEIAVEHKNAGNTDALAWARRSIDAQNNIDADALYFNEKLAGGKWRNIMSPEMSPGQWMSMRSAIPKLDLKNLASPNRTPAKPSLSPVRPQITLEAERPTRLTSIEGFSWSVIKGLGRYGDSIAVLPSNAKTFEPGRGPMVEYSFNSPSLADYRISFSLLPTQPVMAGTGLRLAYSIDAGKVNTIVIDKNVDVGSVRWSHNILHQETVGSFDLRLAKGKHSLQIYAIDTGVVLDKIVITTRRLPQPDIDPGDLSLRVSLERNSILEWNP